MSATPPLLDRHRSAIGARHDGIVFFIGVVSRGPHHSADGLATFRQELLGVRQDPQVRGLTYKWAGDPDLTEDALQIAYYKVATVKDPERIEPTCLFPYGTLERDHCPAHAEPQHDSSGEPRSRPGPRPAQHRSLWPGPVPAGR